jgi:hypothetical protein
MDTYQPDENVSTTRPAFEPLPDGDYNFIVLTNPFADSTKPTKSAKGHWVLRLKLSVGPEQVHVFANPWSGVDKNGTKHDNIAEFLRAVGRLPAAGTEPQWDKLPGARGKAHIKTEISTVGKLAGKPVNTVAYFIAPRDTKEATTPPVAKTQAKPHAFDPDLDVEPDDIPF